MVIYVLNTNLETVGLVESYKSIIWTNRYFEPGDFELYLPASKAMIDLLKENYYLVREGYEDNAMIISSISIKTDIENGDDMTVTGKCLKSILARRIIWEQTTLNGKVEACIRQLITSNCIEPKLTERKIDKLELGTAAGLTETIRSQYTGTNLQEAIDEICTTAGYGYDIKLDLKRKKFIFEMYEGLDRSYRQTKNPYVVFSNEYENLLTTNYNYSKENYRNVARIAGEGEGNERKFTTVGTAADLDRYELFVDAKDISSNEGEIITTEYTALLQQRGNEKLAEKSYTEQFDGEVATGTTFELNRDYYVGDIVEVINEYGIQATPRIIGVIQSEDESGIYTIPIFSSFN